MFGCFLLVMWVIDICEGIFLLRVIEVNNNRLDMQTSYKQMFTFIHSAQFI